MYFCESCDELQELDRNGIGQCSECNDDKYNEDDAYDDLRNERGHP